MVQTFFGPPGAVSDRRKVDSVELLVRMPIYIEELECRNEKFTLIELDPDFTFCGVMNTCA